MRKAIEGLSYWLSSWERRIAEIPIAVEVWIKMWPIAVEATNAATSIEDQVDLQTVARTSDDSEPGDLDTLNTSAGRLVGVFLVRCPNLKDSRAPFDSDQSLKTMRDMIVASPGRAGLIGKHRFVESLTYFLQADPEWAKAHLLSALTSDDASALPLWRAIARQTQFNPVIAIIGKAMAARAIDKRLGRETRQSLVFSLVVECLNSFLEAREPAVPYAEIQQVVRSLDDEVRAHGAGTVQRFIEEVSVTSAGQPDRPTREKLFRLSGKPFLHQVWPQERSLATPGVSKALADLPATCGEAFVEAVDTIERFLVPFDCWSMLEYGLYGEENGKAKLSRIDEPVKAEAFLRLLDKTIGDGEGAIIPMDLANALDQVRKVAPKLIDTPIFRRLGTVARRV
jgi:hypothetical protein